MHEKETRPKTKFVLSTFTGGRSKLHRLDSYLSITTGPKETLLPPSISHQAVGKTNKCRIQLQSSKHLFGKGGCFHLSGELDWSIPNLLSHYYCEFSLSLEIQKKTTLLVDWVASFCCPTNGMGTWYKFVSEKVGDGQHVQHMFENDCYLTYNWCHVGG